MLSLNTIHQGDCLELMKEIPDKSVDMILCDLPYGTTACSWDEIIPLDLLWEQYKRIIRNNGFIVLTASQPFTSKLVMSNIEQFSHQWIWEKEQGSTPLLAKMMPMKNFEDVLVFYNDYKKYDYELKNPLRKYFYDILVYLGKKVGDINKELGNRKAEHSFYVLPKKEIINKIGQRADHVFRYGSTQFGLCTKKTYENILDFYNLRNLDWILPYDELVRINEEFEKTLPDYPRVYNPQKTKGKKYTSGGGYIEHLGSFLEGGKVSDERYPTSIIKFNTDKNKSKHPTQKPVALFEYLIKTYTNKGMLVLDNTCGSGTTAVACLNTERNFICIEKEEKYVKVAQQRIKEVAGCKAESDNGIPPTNKLVGILPKIL